MPLDKSGTAASVSRNIRELKTAGYTDPKQRVAIALDTKRRARGIKQPKRARMTARRR
jgi:hypothetical protein